jgi:hypothetical protein
MVHANLCVCGCVCVCVCVCVCGVRLGTTPSAAQEVAAYGRLAARLVTALAN